MARRIRDPAELGLGPRVQRVLDENTFFRYEDLVERSLSYPPPPYPHHPVVMPDWDNAARRRHGGAQVFLGSTPERYRYWLERVVERTRGHEPRLVFVNAWNEWSEAAYLEPDTRSGHRYLQAHLGLPD